MTPMRRKHASFVIQLAQVRIKIQETYSYLDIIYGPDTRKFIDAALTNADQCILTIEEKVKECLVQSNDD